MGYLQNLLSSDALNGFGYYLALSNLGLSAHELMEKIYQIFEAHLKSND